VWPAPRRAVVVTKWHRNANELSIFYLKKYAYVQIAEDTNIKISYVYKSTKTQIFAVCRAV